MPDCPDEGSSGLNPVADAANTASHPAQSLGDRATGGDANASSLSDLHGVFDIYDDEMELVDLASRYEIKESIGNGGMGKVFLAYDRRLKRRVAIKRIRLELASNRRAFQRFQTEAQSVAALNHPNIVQVMDFGRDREGPFLILEYLDGGTLLQKLEAGVLPVAEAVQIICQILDGLSAAHRQGIIHRDIKPANILLNTRGDAKLADFGLARHDHADAGMTSTGAILGTFDYMSPEQRKDAALTDARSDLWSLAATLYQMVTGELPRVIDLDALPQQLRQPISIGMKSKKEDRYQSALEFRDALLKLETLRELQPGEFLEGECAECRTVNPIDRKFCKNCGTSLLQPCLTCQSAVPRWEKFCGSCGVNAVDAVQTQKNTLGDQSRRIRSLAQMHQYAEAIDLLEQMAAIQDRRFREFADWANSQLVTTREDALRKREEVSRLTTAAKEAFEQCQFKDAARILKLIPEPLLDGPSRELQLVVKSRSDRLKDLSEAIKAAVKSRQFQGLVPILEEYLTLKPTDANARKLAERLRARSAVPLAQPMIDTPSVPHSSPKNIHSPKSVFQVPTWGIVAACGIVAAVVASVFNQAQTTTRTDPVEIRDSADAASSTKLNAENPSPDHATASSHQTGAERTSESMKVSSNRISLFDGQTLNGWHGNKSHWSVKDGAIVGQNLTPLENNSFLVTDATYRNFRLKLKYQLSDGNSGIQIRSVAKPNGAVSGPQVDLDPDGQWLGCLTGELMQPAVIASTTEEFKNDWRASNDRNAWHEITVTVVDQNVSILVNGFKTVEVTSPVIPDTAGLIALQLHSGNSMTVKFKDITLEPLGEQNSAATPLTSSVTSQVEEIRLFNGDNLAGWETIPNRGAAHWTARNGVLTYSTAGQSLATTSNFNDFDLHLEFNLPPGGNSGVFLRGRYEIQLCDGPFTLMNGTRPPEYQNGAVYGVLAPWKQAYEGAGNWNLLDVQLIDRRVTVRMNGQAVINNERIDRVTVGAYSLDEATSGPIVLQGQNVTGTRFRNITLKRIPK
jgi:serine/threonine protein kinase